VPRTRQRDDLGRTPGPQRRREDLAAAQRRMRQLAGDLSGAAASLRSALGQKAIWKRTRVEPGGHAAAALGLAAAAGALMDAAVAADRADGASWEQIGQALGVDASTARRRFAAVVAAPPSTGGTVPATDVDVDENQHEEQDEEQDRAAAAPVPPGAGWEETDIALVRVDGRWTLYGPDGEIEVPGLGFFGWIAARDRTAAQEAAAEALAELTGRTVTAWSPDEVSRSVYGQSSWSPWLT
jgi:hypothetical protein